MPRAYQLLSARALFVAAGLVAGPGKIPPALAQPAAPLQLPNASFLRVEYTFQVAQVPPAQIRQILSEVEKSSFDRPDSWEKELRVRREALGQAEVLVVRGTELLCGGTGNCQTWVFLRQQGRWINLFPGKAPMASGFGFQQQTSLGIRNAVTVTALNGREDRYTVWRYNGQKYRAAECLHVEPFDDQETPKILKSRCD